MTNTADQVWTYVSSFSSKPDIETLKREQTYQLNRKKHVTLVRKNMLLVSRQNSSAAVFIRNIDSLSKRYNCQLVSVIPMRSKEGAKEETIQLQISAGYGSLFSLIRDLKNLPVLFTIKEVTCSIDEETENKLSVKLLIDLITGGDKN